MMYGFWNIERDSVMDIIFCHLGLFFAFFPPLQPKTSKFWKTGKTTRRYYPITHVYHKWQSYDVWFLRHGARWREFFVILDNFLPIYPLKSRKSKILKKWIKGLEILSFYTSVPKIMIMCYWDMACDGCNCYFSVWAIFCPFTQKGKKIMILW